MTASYWSKNFSKTHDTDVIIVGAGFAGAFNCFLAHRISASSSNHHP